MIVGARLKLRGREVLSGGWYGEFFAREKRLKPLKDYFKKSEKPTTVDEKVQTVTRMFDRMIERQANGDR